MFGYEITIRKIVPLEKLAALSVIKLVRSYTRHVYGSLGGNYDTKIMYIKAVRELCPGTSLKDAKEWVELHM